MKLLDFENFYQTMWGERWAELKNALLKTSRYAAHLNPWYEGSLETFFSSEFSQLLLAPFTLVPLWEKIPLPKIQGCLRPFYPMDLASVYPVLALELQNQDEVLDMCAAPGGKSLLLIEGTPEAPQWCLNELSAARRARLKKVLREYLPFSLQSKMVLLGSDGRKLGKRYPESFDKVLLDAPCSGERHLLHKPAELKKWSPARTQQLSRRQGALLASAWKTLRPGGRLVYSTCSISVHENDAVIAAFLERVSDEARIVRSSWDLGEASTWGWQILPDQQGAWGPVYFAVLEKIA